MNMISTILSYVFVVLLVLFFKLMLRVVNCPHGLLCVFLAYNVSNKGYHCFDRIG